MKVHCPQCGEEFPHKRDMTRHLLTAPLGHKKRVEATRPDPDLQTMPRRDEDEPASATWFVVSTVDGIMLTRSPYATDEILSRHRKEEVAEREARRERAFRRGLYEMRLNCAGKVAAHEATGEDLTDVDAGLHCRLRHLGACNREGEDFDLQKFMCL